MATATLIGGMAMMLFPLLQLSTILTVCDVMPELTKFDQKLVEISGIIQSSMEIFDLEGDSCKKYFVTKGYRWPAVLNLAYTDSYLGFRLEGKSIAFGFVTNEASMKLLEKARERVKIDINRRFIRVVIEGMILTGGPDRIVDNIMGQAFSVDGFGHMGHAPATLVIKELKKVEVVNAKGEVLPEPPVKPRR
ncbi:MAG: hypothetical protein JST93_10210 [Acidobacteria bacterium]|nr:hypothetical protein [Acidobacteriota bacterium]